MRIGTWNLAGRWDDRHADLMLEQKCDVWLLTEVSERLALDRYTLHATTACMAPGRRWAAILTQEKLKRLPDPHPASAFAQIGSLKFCSSILPWRACGDQSPWVGARHVDKTIATLDQLRLALPNKGLVWGGDWNHALAGKEYAGSQGGRNYLLATITSLHLKVPTTNLPHHLPDCLSIDHIAVSKDAIGVTADRVEASVNGVRLSDHDAYIVAFR